jgi:hypothetical protein
MFGKTPTRYVFDIETDGPGVFFMAARPEPEPNPWAWIAALVIFGLVGLLLSGCSKADRPTLEAAPPAPVVAKVAVPVACEIEQVPLPDYPGNLIRQGDDVYTLARLAMADRRVRIAERDRLRAANANPCPAHAPKE